MSRPPSERLLACGILAGLLRHEGSLASAFGPALKTHADTNTALVQEFCYGVCRWYFRLHFLAQALLEKPLRAKDSDVYCLILLGLYQLQFMRIPAHAAIHETVEDAGTLGKPWAKNLINAILREAQRREPELQQLLQKDYAAWYSHPEWLLSRLKQDWPADYRAILDANNARAPMTLRVNLLKSSRAAYLELLQQQGMPARVGVLTTTALMLDKPCDVQQLPGFAEGLVSVQDEASQLASALLPLAPGLRVLDACAAPGGKTCALLEAEPDLDLLACDKEERRLPRVRENLARLGQRAVLACLDITEQHTLPAASFDRILLDVPCSATGVIRRHPDIKLLRTEQEVEELRVRQYALLQAAWPLLAPGAYLLYSTCSILHAENQQQISRFIAEHPSAQAQALTIPGARACAVGSQLLPTPDQHDGFYYALLRKY